jgi:hypothetical protein
MEKDSKENETIFTEILPPFTTLANIAAPEIQFKGAGKRYSRFFLQIS